MQTRIGWRPPSLSALASSPRHVAVGCAVGLVGTVATTAALVSVSGRVNVLSMAVCYQLVVLVVSGAFGVLAGLATSVASVLAFNWFFIPPVHEFTIADSRNWISLGVFAATALITAQLGAGFRRQRQEAEARRRDADLLAELARSALADIGSPQETRLVADAAARALGVARCEIVLPGPREEPGRQATTTTRLSASARGFTIPLVGHAGPLGLLEVGPPLDGQEPRWRRPGFAGAVAGVVALAVERSRLVAQALDAEAFRRSDEMKTALLRAVSHELRSPLTAVRTAGEALGQERPAPDAAALVEVIRSESERLERLVANLLDLSRLEAGALPARLDWCDPVEIAAGAIAAAEPLLGGRQVFLAVPAELPLVRADALFCERILLNLIHNALRHGAPPISLRGRIAGGRLELAVEDAGAGPSPDLAATLFRPFVRGSGSGGTGIGLALARGLAEAQGATLRLDAAGRGTRFVLSLPLTLVPEVA
jgi:two-component system sensor histidine kinase KdpD